MEPRDISKRNTKKMINLPINNKLYLVLNLKMSFLYKLRFHDGVCVYNFIYTRLYSDFWISIYYIEKNLDDDDDNNNDDENIEEKKSQEG